MARSSRKRKRSKVRRRASKRARGPALHVTRFGPALAVEYRDDAGHHRRHAFGSGVTLYATADGRQLVIGPVNVGKEIGG